MDASHCAIFGANDLALARTWPDVWTYTAVLDVAA